MKYVQSTEFLLGLPKMILSALHLHSRSSSFDNGKAIIKVHCEISSYCVITSTCMELNKEIFLQAKPGFS